jgi:hypothetical protein
MRNEQSESRASSSSLLLQRLASLFVSAKHLMLHHKANQGENGGSHDQPD